jgi:hypothetical protein
VEKQLISLATMSKGTERKEKLFKNLFRQFKWISEKLIKKVIKDL